MHQAGGAFGFTTGLTEGSLPDSIFRNGWQDGVIRSVTSQGIDSLIGDYMWLHKCHYTNVITNCLCNIVVRPCGLPTNGIAWHCGLQEDSTAMDKAIRDHLGFTSNIKYATPMSQLTIPQLGLDLVHNLPSQWNNTNN